MLKRNLGFNWLLEVEDRFKLRYLWIELLHAGNKLEIFVVHGVEHVLLSLVAGSGFDLLGTSLEILGLGIREDNFACSLLLEEQVGDDAG